MHWVSVACFSLTDPLAEIAEANPHKFRLDFGELESRKQFIRETRGVVRVSEM